MMLLRIWVLLCLVGGSVMIGIALATPGDQVLLSFVGGFLVGHGAIMLLAVVKA